MVIANTPRLILRHFHAADLDAMMAVFGDAEVMRFGPGVQSREWVERWLQGCLEDYYRKWGFGLWAVVHRADRQVVGFCGLTRHADVGGQPEIEIGYRLARRYWGQGIGTEAAQAVRRYAFDVLVLPRVVSIIDPRNAASVRVAEKNGLQFEKQVVFHGHDCGVWAAHSSDRRP